MQNFKWRKEIAMNIFFRLLGGSYLIYGSALLQIATADFFQIGEWVGGDFDSFHVTLRQLEFLFGFLC